MTETSNIVFFQDFYKSLAQDLKDDWLTNERPVLAHYTSMDVAAKIIDKQEIWFSNPLFMNDLEEMRHGMNMGITRFLQSKEVDIACRTIERTAIAKTAFKDFFDNFEANHALDVYIFCLSEHNPIDTDGKLSMWRAYGSQGNGAAIVFNFKDIEPLASSPINVAKVRYETNEARIKWIDDIITRWCNIIKIGHITDDKISICSYALFTVLKFYALTTKHSGFSEEEEWRAIYMPEQDTNKLMKEYFDYIITSRGVEPKLKFPIRHIQSVTQPNFNFENHLHKIILGPTVSSPLAKNSFMKMLDKIDKPSLKEKVFTSSIPLRPMP